MPHSTRRRARPMNLDRRAQWRQTEASGSESSMSSSIPVKWRRVFSSGLVSEIRRARRWREGEDLSCDAADPEPARSTAPRLRLRRARPRATAGRGRGLRACVVLRAAIGRSHLRSRSSHHRRGRQALPNAPEVVEGSMRHFLLMSPPLMMLKQKKSHIYRYFPALHQAWSAARLLPKIAIRTPPQATEYADLQRRRRDGSDVSRPSS
jgi:hypothetical protein